jgi:glycosyltransferase involved in cell wall biosynthesis
MIQLMFGISVIICTHNPRSDYLARTLGALRMQTLSKKQWELLLIDNASKEQLTDTVDLSWHPHARHIREDELGLTPARVRGIRESRGELLIFVDDDNVLEPSFIETASSIHHKFGQLGAFGAGKIIPEFETRPDSELKPYLKMLSIRDEEVPVWANLIKYNGSTPWGAGLCVLREVGLAYAEILFSDKIRRILGRRGKILLSCEDIDLSLFACKLGFGTGVFPELSLVHLIPSRRLERKYLVELAGGNAASHLILSRLWGYETPNRENPILSWFRHLKRLLTLKDIDREIYQAERRGEAKANELFAEHC